MEAPRGRRWAIPALLLIMVAVAFSPALFAGFVDYDDRPYLLDNPRVRGGLTAENVAWAFRTTYFSYWHPLTWLSHMLDCELFGLRAAGHHAVSIALHAANALLLMAVLRRMTGELLGSAAVAVLFAIHPLRVESVAWASERKDVLAGLFWMLALLAYHHYALRPDLRRYALVIAAFIAGLMSKPNLVTLPLILLLLDAWPLRREASFPRRLLEKAPLLVLAGVISLMTLTAQSAGRAVMSQDAAPLTLRLANAAVAYARYLGKLFWPTDLTYLYPYPSTIPFYQWAGALLLLVAITTVAVTQRRRAPYLLMGWLWFIIALLPNIGIVQAGEQALADRYTYLSMIGPAIALVWAAGDLALRWAIPRTAVAAAFGIMVTVLGVLTFRQTRVWHSSETLFRHAIEVMPHSPNAYRALAATYIRDGRTADARRLLEAALRVNPADAEAYAKFAASHERDGDRAAAVNAYERSLELRPNDPATLFALGRLLHESGDMKNAVALYHRALESDPRYDPAAIYLGVALAAGGDPEGAETYYRLALETEPDSITARTNWGNLLLAKADLDGAARLFEQAVTIDPQSFHAHNGLGVVAAQQGRLGDAERHFRAALAANESFAEVHNNLGRILALAGRKADAAQHFTRALELNPKLDSARRNLDSLDGNSAPPATAPR